MPFYGSSGQGEGQWMQHRSFASLSEFMYV